MKWYRFLKSSDDGTTVTVDDSVTSFVFPGAVEGTKMTLEGDGGTGTTGTAIAIGVTATPIALNTAGQSGIKAFFSTTATSDTTYGQYLRLDASGTGAEAIAGRFKTTIVTGTASNLVGLHATVETGASGKASGQSAGVWGNIVLYDRAIVGAGRYYGVLAEIYATGNVAALTTESACLGINLQPGTEIDKVGNSIAFWGTDSSTSMIYSKSATLTATGYIRILVNGAVRYLPFTSTTG